MDYIALFLEKGLGASLNFTNMSKCILRSYVPTDLPSLVYHANNWNVARYLSDNFPHPYTEADGKAFFEEKAAARPSERYWIIEVGSEAVGVISIFFKSGIHRKNVEIGFWLGEALWGQGIMTYAIKRVVDFTFENYDVNRIYAQTFGVNVGSQRALEKNYFCLEAVLEKTLFKKGEYFDNMIYAIRREQWSASLRP